MITVKLFGLLCEYTGQRQFTVKAKTVREAIRKAAEMGIDKKQMHGALIYLNDMPLTGARRLSTKLSDGDELALLSPVSGG